MRENTLLIVANPTPSIGGGNLRAYRSIIGYRKYGFDLKVVFPYTAPIDREVLSTFSKYNISFSGKCKEPISKKLGFRRIISNIEASFFYKCSLPIKYTQIIRGVISMHENPEALIVASEIMKDYDIKRLAILQLPPFYYSKKRLENIELCRKIWLREMYGKYNGDILAEILNSMVRTLQSRIKKILLTKFDKLIAVSPSITSETNIKGNQISVLFPGIALDREDLDYINLYKNMPKKNYIIFSARLAPEKGIIDTLMTFALISRKMKNINLVVTGNIDKKVQCALMRLNKKLGISKKVTFVGYVPRNKLFELKARSKAMIYPSHVDAVPYTVLESLHLNTPVVAYNIPAIRLNYGKFSGVSMVREFDIDGLAEETVNILKGTPKVEAPNWTNWDEIIDQEVSIIKDIIEH